MSYVKKIRNLFVVNKLIIGFCVKKLLIVNDRKSNLWNETIFILKD